MNTTIQDAFNEGRNSSISFEDSQAAQNQKRLNKVISTEKLFIGKKSIPKKMAIYMVDEKKRDVKSFDSRGSATHYIMHTLLKDSGLTVNEVYGALTLALMTGIKTFGYTWRIGKVKKVKKPKPPKYIIYSGWHVRKVCSNIEQVANYLGCSMMTIQRMFKRGATNTDAFKIKRLSVEQINMRPKRVICKDKEELRKILNVTVGMVDDFLKQGATRNNKTYIIQD